MLTSMPLGYYRARRRPSSRRRVMFAHVFRNAMLIVIAGFPAAFVGLLFTGAL